ncbi:MAG: BatA domain-containing protein [Bradymonadia bacterium]
MNFLSPLLLIGLAAALIPPIIHLIHKRKPKQVYFPALEFIRQSQKKTSRRFRIKQLLLMLVRSLLLALLAFALARPYFSRDNDALSATGQGGGSTVIVVDASYPMGYLLEGESLLDKARFKSGQVLDALGSTGQASVIIAGDSVESPVGEVTHDLQAIRRALDDIEPGHVASTLSEGVSRAYDLLEEAPATGGRRVVVLTTAAGAASALPKPPPAAGGSPGIELFPLDVAEGASTPNRAILDVQVRPAPELGVGQWRVDARVANFSDQAVERLPIRLDLNGQPAVRGFVSLPPGGQKTKTFHTRALPDAAAKAEVVLEADNLALDDRRPFWLQTAPQIRVLAVNGDPRPTPHRDELFYLENALSPAMSGGTHIRVTTAAADTLERFDFNEFDVVILANFATPTPEQARDLEAFVRGGGGLLISMGQKIEPEEANVTLARLLPRSLRRVRVAGDAAASAQGGDRRPARLTTFNRAHPVMANLSDPATSSLGRAKIRRYMLLDPSPDAGGEVVMALDDGAPFLLTKVLERGRVALLTGSIDRDWGDLPIRPDFLPLVQQLVRHLTRISEVDVSPMLVGQAAVMPAEDGRIRRVKIVTPKGAVHTLDRPRDEAEPWAFEHTEVPGHYQVQPDPPLPELSTLPGFSVAVDAAAADLRGPKTSKSLEVQRSEAEKVTSSARTELWHAALGFLFLMLAAETGLLFRKRRHIEV